MTGVHTSARADLETIGKQVRKGHAPPEAPSRPSRRDDDLRARRPRLNWRGGGWRRRLLVLGVVAVFLLAAFWVVCYSPLLAVSRVTVKGTHRLTEAQVVQQAQVAHGTPLVRVPRGSITARVEQLPDVDSASVSISFPSTVVITVHERTAAGVLESAPDAWALVDESGRRFNTVKTRPAGLPILSPAPAVAGDPATLSAMAQVSVSVPAAVRPLITEVTASGPEDVTLTLSDHRSVVWGASSRNAEKARVLTALLAQPGGVFNVTNPDLPFTRAN